MNIDDESAQRAIRVMFFVCKQNSLMESHVFTSLLILFPFFAAFLTKPPSLSHTHTHTWHIQYFFWFSNSDRDIFPDGLPEEFSFVSTFRMLGRTNKTLWNLFQIKDINGEPQFGIRLNGRQKAVEFYYINYLGRRETVTFPNVSQVSLSLQCFTRLVNKSGELGLQCLTSIGL